jgi:hypothetical protein
MIALSAMARLTYVARICVLGGEYGRFGDANVRWALTAERLRALAPLLDRARADHQTWCTFDDALPAATGLGREFIHSPHVATDVYTWKLLRRDLRLTRDETEAIMVNLVGILDDRSSRHRRRRIQKRVL